MTLARYPDRWRANRARSFHTMPGLNHVWVHYDEDFAPTPWLVLSRPATKEEWGRAGRPWGDVTADMEGLNVA